MSDEDGAAGAIYRFEGFELRAAERRLLAGDEVLSLGGRAFDLLLALIERRNRVVGKDELMAVVWPGLVVEENNLTVQVSALRKLLGADAVATVAGRGYRFARPLLGHAAGFDAADPKRAPHPVPADADRPSVAVLPFELRSDDAALAFLADGLVEDVIAQLARVPGFFVISRSSSYQFRRGGDVTLPSIARQLGVRYLVEGSVRDIGGRVRVATHLVEAESGRLLWSGQLDSERDATGELQEAIARGVIGELEPALTRAEMTLIRRRLPANANAWDHYRGALGTLAHKGWTEEALREARAGFARFAVEPGFALAAAHDSVITALGLTTGMLADDAATRNAARDGAERALAQGDDDSMVLAYAGCALSDLGQRERGASILRQAVALDPSNAHAHVALGTSLVLQGRPDEGLQQMRHGMLRSPRDRRLGFWGWHLSLFLLQRGRVDEALLEARASAGRDPRLHLPQIVAAAALQMLERSEDARTALAAARRLRPKLTPAEVERVHGASVAAALRPHWDASAPPPT